MRTSYRTYLRSIGRKPITTPVRTEKKPGDKVLVRVDAPLETVAA